MISDEFGVPVKANNEKAAQGRDSLYAAVPDASGLGSMLEANDLLKRAQLEARAASTLSAEPRPFLRWAGSKRWLLGQIVSRLPLHFATYHEPFLGSGALFFLLSPPRGVLSDKCAALINTYLKVRENPSAIIDHLKHMKPDRQLFYAIRANPSQGTYKRVAEFIYLNKTCWNGLYRVNSKGQFNVPFGRPKSMAIADPRNLRACAEALQAPGVTLLSCDFEEALADVGDGDLVYLDPPYVTRHNNNGFIDYNETLFSWEDQRRLAKRALEMADAGAFVIVTNANHCDVLELYRGFLHYTVTRSSTLASDAKCRVRVSEALLCSPNCAEVARALP